MGRGERDDGGDYVKLLGLVLGTAIFVSGCGPTPGQHQIPVTPTPLPASVAVQAPPGYALETKPKYDRPKYFGDGWRTVEGNCDTREVVLSYQAVGDPVDSDKDGCKDDADILDPYTGNVINPHLSQIDHVLSLKRMWDGGAWKWTQQQRLDAAQDRDNLLAVTGAGPWGNEAKGDLGPDKWRPHVQAGWCRYATVYRYTAQKYLILLTPSEDVALRDMSSTCPPR
jgi:hypothetical protein